MDLSASDFCEGTFVEEWDLLVGCLWHCLTKIGPLDLFLLILMDSFVRLLLLFLVFTDAMKMRYALVLVFFLLFDYCIADKFYYKTYYRWPWGPCLKCEDLTLSCSITSLLPCTTCFFFSSFTFLHKPLNKIMSCLWLCSLPMLGVKVRLHLLLCFSALAPNLVCLYL